MEKKGCTVRESSTPIALVSIEFGHFFGVLYSKVVEEDDGTDDDTAVIAVVTIVDNDDDDDKEEEEE